MPMKKPVREIVEQALLTREGMAGALVNNNGGIIFLHGRSGLYLAGSGRGGDDTLIEKVMKLGINKYFAKPVDLKEIASAVLGEDWLKRIRYSLLLGAFLQINLDFGFSLLFFLIAKFLLTSESCGYIMN